MSMSAPNLTNNKYAEYQSLSFRVSVGVMVTELTLIILNIYISTFYIPIIRNKKIFHPNVKFLLIIYAVTQYAFFLTRIERVVGDFLCLEGAWWYYGQFASDIVEFVHTEISTCLVIERLFSTCYGTKYSQINAKVPFLAIFLFIIDIGAGTSVVPLIYMLIIPYWYFYPTFILIAIIVAITSLFLPLIARRHYQKVYKRRYENGVSIENRYHSQENIKTARMLLIIVPAMSITTLVCNVLYMTAWHFIRRGYPEFFAVFGVPVISIYYAIYSLLNTAMMVVILTAHPSLRRAFLGVVPGRRRVFALKEGTPVLRNITGVQISFPIEAERSIHFKEIANAWK